MQKIILRIAYRLFVRPFLKTVVGVKFHTAKFLLNEPQFIIVANHNSHLDTMSIMASMPSAIIHKVRPVAAVDHFGKTKFKAKLSNYLVNTLLIQRKPSKDDPEKDPLNRMIKALDDGFSLIVFPEGTRGLPEVQQPLKPGIGHILAKRPHIKYVPAFLWGMGKAMPKDDNLIVPFDSLVVYGEPTLVKETDVKAIMHQIEGDLNALKAKSHH